MTSDDGTPHNAEYGDDLAKLHKEFLEGHHLYAVRDDDWFVIEQVGIPPSLRVDWDGDELTAEAG